MVMVVEVDEGGIDKGVVPFSSSVSNVPSSDLPEDYPFVDAIGSYSEAIELGGVTVVVDRVGYGGHELPVSSVSDVFYRHAIGVNLVTNKDANLLSSHCSDGSLTIFLGVPFISTKIGFRFFVEIKGFVVEHDSSVPSRDDGQGSREATTSFLDSISPNPSTDKGSVGLVGSGKISVNHLSKLSY